jgi:hypothetical protein
MEGRDRRYRYTDLKWDHPRTINHWYMIRHLVWRGEIGDTDLKWDHPRTETVGLNLTKLDCHCPWMVSFQICISYPSPPYKMSDHVPVIDGPWMVSFQICISYPSPPP